MKPFLIVIPTIYSKFATEKNNKQQHDEQDSTYHWLCYRSDGAVAILENKYTQKGIDWKDSLLYFCQVHYIIENK